MGELEGTSQTISAFITCVRLQRLAASIPPGFPNSVEYTNQESIIEPLCCCFITPSVYLPVAVYPKSTKDSSGLALC
ncbi:hypothetical protein BRADI_2g16001v3 [Brachypodium distachyon]|uniref:Uncharacterized protein n=1 Tax=Brachypodium distachyon TaxID=15368 RepID=A0A0Q3FZM3_BRADI|nr:hypothetical protein BRADI_2g16001v3 [Brachypodium distachyon]